MASKVSEVVSKVVDKLKHCIVCGMGSHRDDWQDETKPPACDSHTKEEIAAAVKKAQDEAKVKAAEEEKAKVEASKTQTPAPPSASAAAAPIPTDAKAPDANVPGTVSK